MSGMILEVQDVTMRFGGLQALSEVTFDLPEGQILGLIGPNGAGKTTLFNVINGVFAPNSGKVIFRGEDITGKPSYEVSRRGLARAHQVVRPLTDLTVRENVMVGACFGREGLHLAAAAKKADTARYAKFFQEMLHSGIWLPPSQFETCFVSLAHTEKDVQETLKAAAVALDAVA